MNNFSALRDDALTASIALSLTVKQLIERYKANKGNKTMEVQTMQDGMVLDTLAITYRTLVNEINMGVNPLPPVRD